MPTVEVDALEIITGDQGSGRSSRLAERLCAVGGRRVILADPAGSWSGRRDPADAVVLGPAVFDGSRGCGLHVVCLLMRRHPGAVVGFDDCEMVVASRQDWAALCACARLTGCPLVLVSPPRSSGIEATFRPSLGRSRLLSMRPVMASAS